METNTCPNALVMESPNVVEHTQTRMISTGLISLGLSVSGCGHTQTHQLTLIHAHTQINNSQNAHRHTQRHMHGLLHEDTGGQNTRTK